MERKVSLTFQVPLTEDKEAGNGEPHPPFRWILLQNEMEVRFGGWSEQDEWTGAWRRPESEEVIREASRVFQVDVEESRQEDAREFIRRVCVTFGQHTVRVLIKGYAEYIEGGSNDEPL